MEGNQCRRLMRDAVPIFAAVKKKIFEFMDEFPPDAEEREGKANKREVDQFLAAFQRLFQYMDLISHFAYQPAGCLSDEDLKDAAEAVKLGSQLWVNLMPTVPMKVHAWQHLLEDLIRFRGLKYHHESNIERAHQIGKKHEQRLHCFRDFQKKTANIMKHTATADLPAVAAMHEDVESKRRKRKRGDDEIADSEAKCVDRAVYLKEILMLPPITVKIPSLLELAMSGRGN